MYSRLPERTSPLKSKTVVEFPTWSSRMKFPPKATSRAPSLPLKKIFVDMKLAALLPVFLVPTAHSWVPTRRAQIPSGARKFRGLSAPLLNKGKKFRVATIVRQSAASVFRLSVHRNHGAGAFVPPINTRFHQRPSNSLLLVQPLSASPMPPMNDG